MSVYDLQDTRSHLERKMFFDGSVVIQRYETVKYPELLNLNRYCHGLFWQPEEINVTKDGTDFKNASDEVKHIFTKNIQRQAMLDSVQGRTPATIFMPCASLPEVEAFITTWSFFESIHSRSYTHILRGIYGNPSEVFDGVNDVPLIVGAAKSIAQYYDDLDAWNAKRNLRDYYHDVDQTYDEYEHKKSFWRSMFASYALEKIRFMVSFCFSFGLAENKLMEGNAKILKLICRDELQHVEFTKYILNTLPKEDSDFAQIKEELEVEMYDVVKNVVNEEKLWSDYAFQKGSVIGMNAKLLKSQMDWFATECLADVGMEWFEGTPKKQPLPWMNNWLGFGKRQTALQESESDQYIIGAIDFQNDDISMIE